MNLVDLVTSQLTGDVLSKLAGMAGIDEPQARPAATAAVPALLSALAKLSSTSSGAGQLATALGGLDLQSLGSLGGGQADGLGSLGGRLLTTLLGDSFGPLAGAVGSYLGTKPGAAQTLLSSLAPLVLGTIAKQFAGSKADAVGVGRLFAEQQGNIAAALPRGLSLAGLDRPTHASHGDAEPSSLVPAWMPFLLLPILGVVGWLLWPKQPPPPPVVVIEEDHERARAALARTEPADEGDRPVAGQQEKSIAAPSEKMIERQAEKPVEKKVEPAPGVAEALAMAGEISGLFGKVSGVLADVKDEASARAAIPRLEEFSPAVEKLEQSTTALPEAGRATVAELVAQNISGLEQACDAVMAVPGVREIVGPAVAPIVDALRKLGK